MFCGATTVAALAFVQAVHPERLAGGGIDRDHVAARAGREVEDAADHQRRHFPVEVGTLAEVLRLPSPAIFRSFTLAALI